MQWWIILIVMSAILGSISLIFKKKALINEHANEYLANFKLLELGLLLFFLPIITIRIPFYLIGFIFLTALITAIALLFINRSYRHMDLSVVSPLTNFTPAFLVVIAYFLLGETIGVKSMVGIGLLLFGTYYLEAEHSAGHWVLPFKKIKSKFFIFLFIGLFLSAIIAVAEKFIIASVSPFTLLFYHYSFQTAIYLGISFFLYDGLKDIIHGYKTSWKWLLGNAFFANLSNIFYLFAISLTFVSLATPVKKISTLFTIFLSGKILKEKRIFHKSLACCIMLIGVFIIAM